MVEGGLSLHTIRSTLVTARHFCKWLYQESYLPEDISSAIKVPTQPPMQPKAISAEVAIKLIEAALEFGEDWQRARNTAILFLLRDTGCRVGGLTNALLPNLDLERRVLETTEKGKVINLFFTEPTKHMIETWLEFRSTLQPVSDHLFIAKHTRGQLTRGGFTMMLRSLAQKAGIEDRRNPHSWRHAFARDFLLDGGEFTQLAELMHHSSIWVTFNYYARWNIKHLHTAHDAHSPIKNTLAHMEFPQ